MRVERAAKRVKVREIGPGFALLPAPQSARRDGGLRREGFQRQPVPQAHGSQRIAARFKIAGGKAGLEISWQVTGVRQDAYAKAHPLVVEQGKGAFRASAWPRKPSVCPHRGAAQ